MYFDFIRALQLQVVWCEIWRCPVIYEFYLYKNTNIVYHNYKYEHTIRAYLPMLKKKLEHIVCKDANQIDDDFGKQSILVPGWRLGTLTRRCGQKRGSFCSFLSQVTTPRWFPCDSFWWTLFWFLPTCVNNDAALGSGDWAAQHVTVRSSPASPGAGRTAHER